LHHLLSSWSFSWCNSLFYRFVGRNQLFFPGVLALLELAGVTAGFVDLSATFLFVLESAGVGVGGVGGATFFLCLDLAGVVAVCIVGWVSSCFLRLEPAGVIAVCLVSLSGPFLLVLVPDGGGGGGFGGTSGFVSVGTFLLFLGPVIVTPGGVFRFLDAGGGTMLFGVCGCTFLFFLGTVISASESGGVFLFTGALLVAVCCVGLRGPFLLLLVPAGVVGAGGWIGGLVCIDTFIFL